MKKKKATAGTAATKSKLRMEHYQNGKHLSSLKYQIGELLLFGDKQQSELWNLFEVLLRQYLGGRV